jgi:hypothetical protein
MDWKIISDGTQIRLAGIRAEVDRVGTVVKAVIVTDENNRSVRFRAPSYGYIEIEELERTGNQQDERNAVEGED